MEPDVNAPPGLDPVSEEVFVCTSCQLPLPLRICPTCDEARSVSCAGCGARYRGIVLEVPDLEHNIRVVASN